MNDERLRGITPAHIDEPKEDETVLKRFYAAGGGHRDHLVGLMTKDLEHYVSHEALSDDYGYWVVKADSDKIVDNSWFEFKAALRHDVALHPSAVRRVWIHRPARFEGLDVGAHISPLQRFKGTGGLRGKEIRLMSEDEKTEYGCETVSKDGTWEIVPSVPLPEGKIKLLLVQDPTWIGSLDKGEEVGKSCLFGFEVMAKNKA